MSARNSKLKESLYIQKYNEWKEKKFASYGQKPDPGFRCSTKGPRKSLATSNVNASRSNPSITTKRLRCRPQTECPATVHQPGMRAKHGRRQTIEIPAALRNSPIHLLPHVRDHLTTQESGKKQSSVETKNSHTASSPLTRIHPQSHPVAARRNGPQLLLQSKPHTPSTNKCPPNQRKGAQHTQAVIKRVLKPTQGAQSSNKYASNHRQGAQSTKRLQMKPHSLPMNTPQSAPKERPRVLSTTTSRQLRKSASTCQHATGSVKKNNPPQRSLTLTVLRGETGDYMERFHRWKEQKQEVKKNGSKIKDMKQSGISQPISGRTRMLGVDKTILVNKTSKPVNRQTWRRRTLEVNTETKTTCLKPELYCRRRTMPGSSSRLADNSSTVSSRANATRPCSKRALSMKSDVIGLPEVKKARRSSNIMTSLPSKEYSRRPTAHRTQQSLKAQLDDWLKAKGKTPSRFRHMMCYGAHMSAAQKRSQSLTKPMLSVDDLSQQQRAMDLESVQANLIDQFEQSAEEEDQKRREVERKLDTILEECMTLFEAGCPVTSLLPWLDSMQDNIPGAVESAKYWICKARVFKATKNTNQVLEVFEQAVRHSAKPADALAKTLTEMVREMTEIKPDDDEAKEKFCYTPRKSQVQLENVFHSSAIKFCVKNRTPLLERLRGTCGSEGSSPRVVVTPVRRSTRRSLATIHESLQEKDQLYDSFSDIPTYDKELSLYQHNLALEDVLSLDDLQ